MSTTLIREQEFGKIAEIAMKASTADDVWVQLQDRSGGTARFANNQIIQNIRVRRYSLNIQVAFGKKKGSSSTSDLSKEAIRAAVRAAEQNARGTPEDPEYLPPLPPQQYDSWKTAFRETTEALPLGLIDMAGHAIQQCKKAGLSAAGIAQVNETVTGLAANHGLFAYQADTSAEFSLTATGKDSSGWVKVAHRDFRQLDVQKQTAIAIEKAATATQPKEISAGKYTVILEPAAVAGLIGPLIWAMDAKSYYHGTSALREKLGKEIIDNTLSLRSCPSNPDLLGGPFAGDGLPNNNQTWISKGVLKQLYHDRFTARQKGVDSVPWPSSPLLSGEKPVGNSVDDLIGGTKRGILVTNFWYIRYVNPSDLTLTGMTRDGTYLIEDGKIQHGLINFRWHESPLRAFNQIEAYTQPLPAITMERGKMLLPALKVRDFNFSSATRF